MEYVYIAGDALLILNRIANALEQGNRLKEAAMKQSMEQADKLTELYREVTKTKDELEEQLAKLSKEGE